MQLSTRHCAWCPERSPGKATYCQWNITRDEEVPTIESARRHIIADDRSEGAWAIERQHVRRGLSAKQLTHGNQRFISSLKQMISHWSSVPVPLNSRPRQLQLLGHLDLLEPFAFQLLDLRANSCCTDAGRMGAVHGIR